MTLAVGVKLNANTIASYQRDGHIVTWNLKIITNSRIWSVPKNSFPSPIDFIKCCEEIASVLQEFYFRWCKREHVEYNALNTWKIRVTFVQLLV